MRIKAYTSPGKFFMGAGILSQLEKYIKKLGDEVLLIAHVDDSDRVGEALVALEKANVTLAKMDFSGECTEKEIERGRENAQKCGAKVIMGLGGGKAIDTAKVVANLENLPLMVVPTIASTDAPCSTLAVVYNDDHNFEKCYIFPKNPDIVVADTEVIANAPARFLAAGIGDAYATFFEARSCMNSSSPNYTGGVSTQSAFALAKLCHQVLLDDAEKAMQACRDHTVTPALENIVEANLLMSGIGFESSGLAAAHSFYNTVTMLSDVHKHMHGEMVAIGVLFQHVLENEPIEQIRKTIAFFKTVGLPTTLAEIGITKDRDEKLWKVATSLKGKGGSITHLPFEVNEKMAYNALRAVDGLSKL